MEAAAGFIINGFGGYEGILAQIERSVVMSVDGVSDVCAMESNDLIVGIRTNFLKQCGFLVRGLVNSFLKTYPSVIDKEISGIIPHIDRLKENETFKAICRDSPTFNHSLKNSRVAIMVIDAMMMADNVKNGPIGVKFVAAWRKMHPEKSFGGRRRRTSRRKFSRNRTLRRKSY